MSSIGSLAQIASLIGEPARTAILVSLMDGRALTAGELAEAAGVTAATASGHLGRLLEGGLLALERQGRHRYYRLASPAVAATLEGMMALDTALRNEAPSKRIATGPKDRALRRARRCYDHLAGEVAVAIADAMAERGQLDLSGDGAALTEAGRTFLGTLDIAVGARRGGATFCRPCLDWSERRPHIAGAVGAALYRGFVDKGWMRQAADSRAVAIMPPGRLALERHFGIV
ncbi:helix-turn-helix transcriptional regulator [Sphingosinicella sp. BN140058]|uniref:ArsR/SmtB family transcription factor n=1 Tax=Sphingosinicella sp. BN140058 TaxID=1892855 RepID=UPI0010104820|nr:helix-turn-helix transcriptional regulator [Sphingosinicella sp. BN140058]QAY77853.1 transcriptional regulator [Sphingosinicella sp. BN140058]